MTQHRTAVKFHRMNWGCGPNPPDDWLNVDRIGSAGVSLRSDIRDGLPLCDACLDYIVSIHALQDLPYLEIVPALVELRRVLRPGGVLRLGLPDLERGVAALLRNDPAYFYVPDSETQTISGKFIVQMTWYGASRSMFTWDFARELLLKAGFRQITRSAFQRTGSRFLEITTLDNRERESLFIEACK